jgi:hypothetical protein
LKPSASTPQGSESAAVISRLGPGTVPSTRCLEPRRRGPSRSPGTPVPGLVIAGSPRRAPDPHTAPLTGEVAARRLGLTGSPAAPTGVPASAGSLDAPTALQHPTPRRTDGSRPPPER